MRGAFKSGSKPAALHTLRAYSANEELKAYDPLKLRLGPGALVV